MRTKKRVIPHVASNVALRIEIKQFYVTTLEFCISKQFWSAPNMRFSRLPALSSEGISEEAERECIFISLSVIPC